MASRNGCGTSAATPKSAATKWQIWVSGYGEFEFDGTEAEAEDMRQHKARWEGGQGRKWRSDLSRESDRLTAELVGLWSSHQGAPQSLLSRLRKALDAEATTGSGSTSVAAQVSPPIREDVSNPLGSTEEGKS